jgi:hypothetical protein
MEGHVGTDKNGGTVLSLRLLESNRKKKKKNIHKARLCVLQFRGKRLIPVGIIRKDS